MQVYTAKALKQFTTCRTGATNAHTDRSGPPWVFIWTSSPEDSWAEGQGSWLPCRERAAGHPLLFPGALCALVEPARLNPSTRDRLWVAEDHRARRREVARAGEPGSLEQKRPQEPGSLGQKRPPAVADSAASSLKLLPC